MKYNLKNKLLSQLKNSKSLKNQVEILGYFYVENYNYRLKNIIIQEAIKELELPIIFTKKGIKKGLKNWHGWRRSNKPKGIQYCVKSHSGYVVAFIIPEKFLKSPKSKF